MCYESSVYTGKKCELCGGTLKINLKTQVIFCSECWVRYELKR